MEKQVTILIPNYKTPDLTKLCLRLLRKYTDGSETEVIAIDNDSADESLAYLRSLSWIKLIERPKVPTETPSQSHCHALDLALQHVQTPLVISLHTDTLVKRGDWLPFLLNQIHEDKNVAGVGSWKLETKTWLQRLGKTIETGWQTGLLPLLGKKKQPPEEIYLRSHCALYRMDLIRKYNLSFGDGDTAGKIMHRKLVAQGHRMIFIPSAVLGKYMVHIDHATMVINPALGARKRTISKGWKRAHHYFEELNAEQIWQDHTLDH